LSIGVPVSEFINTLFMWFEQFTVIILFAFAWNFETYKHKILLKRLDRLLEGIVDLE